MQKKMSDQLKGMRKELKHLEDEIKKSEKLIEQIKKRFSDDIKKMNKSEIINSTFVEKKYTLWERIKRSLGMN